LIQRYQQRGCARAATVAFAREGTDVAFDWTFKTNVYAMFRITKAAMAYLGSGSTIINTISACDPSEDQAAAIS